MNDKMISDKVTGNRVMSGKKQLITYHFLIYIFLLFSCREPAPQVPANKLPERSISEDMMLLNKEFAEFEDEEINHYIDSLNLDMSQTISGLRYKIIKEGYGRPLQKGGKVTFIYSIRTLDDTECEELKNVTTTIELGKGAIKSGIEEAVGLVQISGQGRFIIPSHLAYGVSGYKNCVPAWTPVFCEINVIDVSYAR